ncbi:MAG: carboxypeptidase-like regulatory domain-containing protein [Nanopusillaceae archaeon]
MPAVIFQVMETASSLAISGATCTVRAAGLVRSATTDNQGRATVSFSSGEWSSMVGKDVTLEVSHPNYRTASATFRLDSYYKDKDWGPHLFGLARLPGYVPPQVEKVRLEIRDARTRQLIPNASVTLTWTSPTGVKSSQKMTAASGTLEVEYIVGVTYNVRVEASGYRPYETTHKV